MVQSKLQNEWVLQTFKNSPEKLRKGQPVYPDREDVKRVCKLCGVPQPSAEVVWPGTVLLLAFLQFAHKWCRNHGRHSLTPASDLKQQAEDFIGKSVTDHEF